MGANKKELKKSDGGIGGEKVKEPGKGLPLMPCKGAKRKVVKKARQGEGKEGRFPGVISSRDKSELGQGENPSRRQGEKMHKGKGRRRRRSQPIQSGVGELN